MGVNGLLPRLIPACHEVDLTRLLRDGLPDFDDYDGDHADGDGGARSRTRRHDDERRTGSGGIGGNKRRRTESSSSAAAASSPPPARDHRHGHHDGRHHHNHGHRRRSSSKRRKVRVAVDASGWIARACHGQGASLLDERHLTNYGRAELAAAAEAAARSAASEQQKQRALENGADEKKAEEEEVEVDSSDDDASNGRPTPPPSPGNADNDSNDSKNSNGDNSNGDGNNEDELTLHQLQHERTYRTALRDEFVRKCVTSVTRRVLSLRDDCNADVLVVIDGASPPGKKRECGERRGRRERAAAVRDAPGTVVVAAAAAGASATTATATGDGVAPAAAAAAGATTTTTATTDDDRIKAARRAGASSSSSEGDGQVQSLVIQAVLVALRSERVPFLVAPYESDGQLAYLSHRGLVDLIVTDDSDLVGLGAKNLIYKLTDYDAGGAGRPPRGRLIRRCDLGSVPPPLSLMDFTDVMLACMFVAAGCDYCPSLKGIGVVTARNAVKAAFHGEDGGMYCEPDGAAPRRRRRRGGGDGGEGGGASAKDGRQKERRAPVLRRVFHRLYASCYGGSKLSDEVRADYELNFLRALLMYRHPVAFDPLTGRCVFANADDDAAGRGGVAVVRPDPELAEYGPYMDLVADVTKLEGVVGTLYGPTRAVQVAEGWVNPRTGKLHDEGSTPGEVVEAFRAAAAAEAEASGPAATAERETRSVVGDTRDDQPRHRQQQRTQDDGDGAVSPTNGASASAGQQQDGHSGPSQPSPPPRPSQGGMTSSQGTTVLTSSVSKPSSSQGTTLTSSVSKPSTQGSSQPSHASNLSADVLSPNLLASPLPPSPAVSSSGGGGGGGGGGGVGGTSSGGVGGMRLVLERLTGRRRS